MPARASRPSAASRAPAVPAATPASALTAQLHDWGMTTGRRAATQPREFLAELARLEGDAAAGGALPEVVELRRLALRVAEGTALMRMHDNDRAAALLERTLRALQARLQAGVPVGAETEVRRWMGSVQLNLGTVAKQRGDLQGALRWFRLAGELFGLIGERGGAAIVLNNTSNVFGEAGLEEEELRFGREALAIERELGRTAQVALVSFNLSDVLLRRGDFAGARRCCLDAEREWQRAGRTEWVPHARIQLALVDGRAGRPAAALARLRRLAAECRSAACRTGVEPLRLETLGGVLAGLGRWREAATAYAEALAILREAPNRNLEAKLLVRHGRAQLELADESAARAAAERALAAFREIGLSESGAADAEELLAECARRRGDWEAAWRHERGRHEAWVAANQRDRDRRAAVLAAQHQLDLARAEADRQRAENARLSEALAAVAARLKPAAGPGGGAVAGNAGGTVANALPEEPASLRPLGLTKRESEVLWWVAEGKTNDEICAILGTSLANVKKQLQHIYVKLGVENRTAAAGRALRHLRGG